MKAVTSIPRRTAASKLMMGATRSMASGKEIRFGVEGRAAMLKGVDLLADAVQVRLFTCLSVAKSLLVPPLAYGAADEYIN